MQKKYKGQKSMFIVLHLYHVLASLTDDVADALHDIFSYSDASFYKS